ncbi:hypothetical protein U9M48_004920, partial [Paspalum notatum var. saurae]
PSLSSGLFLSLLTQRRRARSLPVHSLSRRRATYTSVVSRFSPPAWRSQCLGPLAKMAPGRKSGSTKKQADVMTYEDKACVGRLNRLVRKPFLLL